MAKPDQTTDSDNQPPRGNMVGSAGGTYYEFATGHVGQDEEHLGDDNRAFEHWMGPKGAKGSKGKDINSDGTKAF